jgi:hypothetical protein
MAEVKVDTGKAQENVVNLQREMRKLLTELRNLESGSEEFVRLSEKVGELQDKINDAGEAARANAGPAFERLGNNFGLVTQKLSSLDFQGAAESMKALGSSIGSISFKELTDGLKNFGSTIASVGKSLLTNPIFLVAAALTAAYLAFDAYREAQEAKVNAFIDRVDEKIQNYKRQQEIEVAQAKGNAEEIYRINSEYRAKEIEDTQKQIDKLKSFNLGRNGMTDEQKKKLGELNTRYKDLLKEQEIAEINHTNVISDERAKQLENYNSFIKGVDDRYNQSTMSAREFAIKQSEDRLREDIKKLNETKAANENYSADLKRVLELQRIAEIDINKKFDQEEAAKRKQKQDEIKQQKENEKKEEQEYYEWRRNELNKFLDDRNKTEVDAFIKTHNAEREASLENEKIIVQSKIDYAALWKSVDEKAAEEKRLRDARVLSSQVQMASDAMGALMSLTEALSGDNEKSARRAFKINKALSLAQAIMSTYQAVNAQLAVPQDALTGANFVKAGIALATGLANVIKIQKTKFEGGGGGGSSAPSGGGSLVSDAGGNQSTATPAFNVLDTGFLENRPAQGNPVQAYVLSSDVSSSLEASQKLQSLTVL